LYRHQTGLYVGVAELDYTWVNDDGFTTPFTTMVSSGTDIPSLISNGIAAYTCYTSAITGIALTNYILTVTLEDNDVSPASGVLELLVYDGTFPSISDKLYDGNLEVGTNVIEFTSVSADMFMILASGTDTGDYTLTFELYKKLDELIPIDIVTDEEWVGRRHDALTIPTEDYPIGKLSGDYLYIAPREVEDVVLFYLRKPTDPVFDYYIDVNLNIVPMAVSSSHTLGTGEVYRDGTTTGSKTSTTVELEWEDIDQIKILHRILAKLGVSMDEQLVAQYAMAEKNS
jgi:hypothetical protein